MYNYPKTLAKLITHLSKIPGVGEKSAQRMAFYMLGLSDEEAKDFASSIVSAKENMKYCTVCGNLTDEEPCSICRDSGRNQSLICVVESPQDVVAIEKMREYKGLYHVLHGSIDPMKGIGPEDIKLTELIVRLRENDAVKEVILATNPNIEGEATAMYAAKLISPSGIKVSRIARGIPIGGDLEYTDGVTILKAIEGRSEIQ